MTWNDFMNRFTGAEDRELRKRLDALLAENQSLTRRLLELRRELQDRSATAEEWKAITGYGSPAAARVSFKDRQALEAGLTEAKLTELHLQERLGLANAEVARLEATSDTQDEIIKELQEKFGDLQTRFATHKANVAGVQQDRDDLLSGLAAMGFTRGD